MELLGRRFGHIRVTEVVGQGGMGDVYAGFDEKLERKVALKVLNSNQRLDDDARERLLREARALSKLEHPHICRIHDYIESADCDLLVLEYIDGRTLHAAQQEPMSRTQMLRVAVAIAEVLVTAHRAGIVHRDLKPDNVMLTQNGEVKVLDFGLARWLNRARAHASDRSQAARMTIRSSHALADALADTVILAPHDAVPDAQQQTDNHATAVGVTLGTPLYMSPEQARGEPLTPASDMFSFGLVLQRLFTGKEPHPDDLRPGDVIFRAANGETLPVSGAAGDITALINRLKHFAPADRPTAIETLERLRHMQEKPQRIARRAIVAVLAAIALLGAWRYTVDLRIARAEADKRRAQAEDLIEFMLGDLRKKLEPVGRLEVLDDVGERALKYVGSANPESMSASDLTRGAKALNQLVEVRIAQGKLDDAMTLAERSLQMTTIAARKMPDDPETQLALGTSHFWVGNVWRLRGDLSQALPRMQSYSTITDALARAHPGNETYELERAYGHSVVGTIYEGQGRLREALDQYRHTRDVKAARVQAKPADLERHADLAETTNKIGFVLLRLGDLGGAREHFARELATYERLVALDPKNHTWKNFLARAHGFSAASAEIVGDPGDAVGHVGKELDILTALYALDSTNTQWTRNLAMAHLHRAWLSISGNDLGSAAMHAGASERLMRGLLQKDPQSKPWRREHALGVMMRGRVRLLSGSPADARREVDTALEELQQIGTAPLTLRTIGEARLLAGDIALAAGDRTGALASWSAAAAQFETLPSLADDPNTQATYVRTLLRLGRTSDAERFTSALARAGYRHPDYVADLKKFAEKTPLVSVNRVESLARQ